MSKTAGVTATFTLTNGGGKYTKTFKGADPAKLGDTDTAKTTATKYARVVAGELKTAAYTTSEDIDLNG